MNKITKITAIAAVLAILPFAALAHGTNVENALQIRGSNLGVKAQIQIKNNDGDNDNDDNVHIPPIVATSTMPMPKMPNWPWQWHKSTQGSVTAVSSTGFSLQGKNGTAYTVNVSGTTKIVSAYGVGMALSSIQVNDNALVVGTISGSQINASSVIVTPQNTHPAKAVGTVTAVNGNSITLQAGHTGVPYSVTVNTNASTTVMSNGTATTTAAIVVGSKISVKGLWDELLNVLNAIKIKIQ